VVVAGVNVLQPPRAGLARAVCALAADELQEGQGGCPRGPKTDEGVEEGAVLLEVESFPLCGRSKASGAPARKSGPPWPLGAGTGTSRRSRLFWLLWPHGLRFSRTADSGTSCRRT